MIDQKLPVRYVDKQKLGNFWRTHDNFKGENCCIKAMDKESYVVSVPRIMTAEEIQGVWYDKEVLDRMAAEAAESYY